MRKIVNNVIVFDDAIKCEKCGTLGAYDCTSTFLCGNCMPKASPIALQGLVLLRCPGCNKTTQVKKEPTDPPQCVEVRTSCEECVSGGFDDTAYYDARGKEITGS